MFLYWTAYNKTYVYNEDGMNCGKKQKSLNNFT